MACISKTVSGNGPVFGANPYIILRTYNNAAMVRGYDELRLSNASGDAGLAEVTPVIGVTVSPPDTVKPQSANVSGAVELYGMASADVTLFYGTSDGGMDVDGWDFAESLGSLSASDAVGSSLSDLVPGTDYFYRFMVSNAVFTAVWSETAGEFRTPMLPAAFDYGMKISFPNYAGSEPLENFPVLLRLSASEIDNFSYGSFKDDGSDLRFADSTGEAALAYEIQKWNPDGESLVWVKIPELTDETEIWAYWGNEAASLPNYAKTGETWSEGFRGVWHFDEAGTDDRLDSSGFGNHAIYYGTPANSDGVVGAGAGLEGSTSNYMDAEKDTSLNINNELSISLWVRTEATGYIVTRTSTAGDYRYYALYNNATTKEISFFYRNSGGSNSSLVWAADVSDGAWHHLALSVVLGQAELFVDGASLGVKTWSNGWMSSSVASVYFGKRHNDYALNGNLDEARIAAATRSADWVLAEYESTKIGGALVTYAAVEATDATAPFLIPLTPVDVGATSATLVGDLLSGALDVDVTCFWGLTDGGENAGAWAYSNKVSMAKLGAVTNEVSGLSPATRYYFRFLSENESGSVWSSETLRFSTLGALGAPTVITTAASDITENSATLNGEVIAGNPDADVWFYWGAADGGDNAGAWEQPPVYAGQYGLLPADAAASGMIANKTYYYRAFASNVYGAAWAASSESFTTGSPSLSIGNASVEEGTSGTTTQMVFTVSVSTPSAVEMRVDYATADGTATVADDDYLAAISTAVIAPLAPSQGIAVTVVGDYALEQDETLTVTLSSPVNARIDPMGVTGVGTIINDDLDYFVRVGGPYGTGTGDTWENALGTIGAAWGRMDFSDNKTRRIFIEKTGEGESYPTIRKSSGASWYLKNIALELYGGLTPVGDGQEWTKTEGDVSRVVSVDPDMPALRITSADGVGGYYTAEFHIRMDDMVLVGGDNEGAVMAVAIGYLSITSLTANRTVFMGGKDNTQWPVVGFSPRVGYPSDRSTASARPNVTLDRVLIIGNGSEQGGLRASAPDGGYNLGHTTFRITNSAILNCGSFGIFGKGMTYQNYAPYVEMYLDHVTIAGVDVGIIVGDASNASSNLVNLNRSLFHLNNPGALAISSLEETVTRKTKVSGSHNAFYNVGQIIDDVEENIEFTGEWADGPDQLLVVNDGSPGLAEDGYHLTRDSDPWLIDRYTGEGPDVDIDGDSRPQGRGSDIGADEYKAPAGLLILIK